MIDHSDYQKTVLANGVRVISERMPHVRSISLGLWMETGTRDERPEENGISHFIEHMVFKGTRRRKANEIAESIESVGGAINAFTSKEVTCYYSHMLDEHLELAVDVLADILTEPLFDTAEIDKERTVVIEEINSVEDTPEDLVHELFYQDLFPSHALGASTLGTRATVSHFSREQLLDYKQRHYTRNRIVVVAAGNLRHEDFVALVQGRLDPLPANGARKWIPPLEDRKSGTVKTDDCAQTHVCLGTRGLRFDDPRKFSLLTMNTLLGGGMSSRLFQNIRERHGLAYSVFSFHDFMRDTGVFGAYLGTEPGRELQAVALLKEELHRLCEERVPATELERTKNQLKGGLMLGLEGTGSRASRLANMEIYLGRYYSLDEVLEGISQVTSEDMQSLAQALFVEKQQTLTVIRPSAKK